MNLLPIYFPELDENQLKQLNDLALLLSDWNQKINVISRKDIDQLNTRHIMHSLSIARVQKFNDGAHILDVGTGGGLPGIPLAIMFPHCQFHLIDSIGKKIKVVTEVANALGLENVRAEQIRAEQVDGEYDFIVSRAVTRITPFYGWVKGKVNINCYNKLKNGILYLKGGDLTEEIKESKLKAELYPLSAYFDEAFFETKYVVYIPQ